MLGVERVGESRELMVAGLGVVGVVERDIEVNVTKVEQIVEVLLHGHVVELLRPLRVFGGLRHVGQMRGVVRREALGSTGRTKHGTPTRRAGERGGRG